jgi:SH3-like domain-containing protein
VKRLLCAVAVCAALGAQGAEFRTVAENGAILYDAPSRQATPLFVVSRDYPVEVLVELEPWVKVRDHTGALSWIEKRLLGERRIVLVIAPSAEARLRPQEDAPVAFVVAENVTLELLGPAPGGWLRVRHADGADGYVLAAQVWGQ